MYNIKIENLKSPEWPISTPIHSTVGLTRLPSTLGLTLFTSTFSSTFPSIRIDFKQGYKKYETRP